MTNNFVEEYKRYADIRKVFASADNEADKERFGDEYHEFITSIDAKGAYYSNCFCMYIDMMESENNYIDFPDTIDNKEIPKIVNTLRSLGFRKFTISSQDSGLLESVWAFLQNGCHLVGIIEINRRASDETFEDIEQIPALLIDIGKEVA